VVVIRYEGRAAVRNAGNARGTGAIKGAGLGKDVLLLTDDDSRWYDRLCIGHVARRRRTWTDRVRA